ncbi:MAG: GAF domain-containing sensor histidine kinase [Cytophagaceae bacterium]|nr:GAF domain-containing sensor histidine kinase [Gemmatimonadaceae bacterium]
MERTAPSGADGAHLDGRNSVGLRIPTTLSGASRQLRALAALSGSLTDALTPSGAADLVEQKALSALGATSAVVVTLGAFPPPADVDLSPDPSATLHVVHGIGLPAELRAAVEQQPLDAPLPFSDVARNGEPLFLESPDALLHYPDWGAAMILAGAHAAAVVPVWANGELRGVLGLSWPTPRSFDDDERAFVLTLGVMCAQAIMRAHLKAAERDARDDAERANLSKANFVATISHELRTPINAVIAYTDILAQQIDGPVNDGQQRHLGRMRASGKHLIHLIDELLSHARIEAAEETVRPEPVLLDEVVEASIELVRPLAELKGLHIRVEKPEKPVELHTDPVKLRQILVNLVANAVKFTNTGSVVIVVRVEGIDAELRVILEVTDTGAGLSVEDMSHVFDPFWQKDPQSTHSGGSTGLGLSVARQLARLLGGDLVIAASEPSRGSTFVVSIPARYVPTPTPSPLSAPNTG